MLQPTPSRRSAHFRRKDRLQRPLTLRDDRRQSHRDLRAGPGGAHQPATPSRRLARQDLGQPAGVVGGPPVAAADPAGHAVAVVGAVDVVPAGVAAERAGSPDVAALTVAFEAVLAGRAVAVGAGHDAALAWWGDGGLRRRHLAWPLIPRMHHGSVRLQPLVRPRAQESRRRQGLAAWAAG